MVQVAVLAGRGAVWVEGNNIHHCPDLGRPASHHPLTTSGEPGTVYHGVADWLYEEEILGASRALWVSPDQTHLAFLSFNDSKVGRTQPHCLYFVLLSRWRR